MKFKNTGKVLEIKDGIVLASGLSEVGYNETVKIKTPSKEVAGLVLNLEEDQTGIVLLDEYDSVEEGQEIVADRQLLSINVSEEYLSHAINPLGKSLEGGAIKAGSKAKNMPLEKIAPSVSDRGNVNRPMQTGIKAIDAMIPIGKGQRELIIGDRQTGKTAIAVDSIINQKDKDMICIYVAIGQKSSKIAQIRSKLEIEGALENTVIVAANASDPAAMQYIAPYAGVAIAEYFAEQGRDALIIYDDLTKHSWAYREISLLLRRPPGREAYPGDVFYLHSRLLERAVQYSKQEGGGSITALPIIETQAGDISAYIPTNVISITDGQIYLESELFNAGQRPAINIGLSVSRVGGAAQTPAMKQVAGQLRLDLAQYRELAAFAQFGSELDKETQEKLDRGARMQELLKQPQYDPLDVAEQVLILFAGTRGFLDKIEVEKILDWERQFLTYINAEHRQLVDRLNKGEKIEGKQEKEIEKIINKFNEQVFGLEIKQTVK
ncbi:F0F1 ATP synthase subunit alpha [Candidatus Dojkabacteria bacterium]|nr:F0F1 ATP synthase subunit alpha [Candidatus Dojkabacteria bacterium]